MDTLLAAAEVAGTTDRAVLIATLGGIIVTTITGLFAVITNRRNHTDPEPALIEVFGDAAEQWMQRIIDCERECANHQAHKVMWEQRARDLGWSE